MVSDGGAGVGDTFTKTICSICYEDLKPIVEDLQAISICGHVFHELCLQQWFEYCPNAKKQTCPVCKQNCSSKNVGRLYFQSIGDLNDSLLSRSQNVVHPEENPELLRKEVKRLEAKVSGLNLAVDGHQKELSGVSEALRLCKEQLAKEVTLKNEALKQKESIQQVLLAKSSELARTTLECSRLQETNLALAKELAALKLISDCNLEEEEVVKLASLGNEANSKDAIDVLKKSLVIRNKCYKELMAKCNTLGRGEAHSLRKLERAKEKIVKMKTRIKELEIAIEARDNKVLRKLKASKKEVQDDMIIPSVSKNFNCPSLAKHSHESQKELPPVNIIDLDEDGELGSICGVKERDIKLRSAVRAEDERSTNHQVSNLVHLTDEDEHGEKRIPPKRILKDGTNMLQISGKDATMSTGALKESSNSDIPKLRAGATDSACNNNCAGRGGAGLLLQDIMQVQPSLHTRTEVSSAAQLSEQGNRCFSGGLLGPDGSTRYLGKWCKRAEKPESKTSQVASGNLIAVGADGRGGQIKVLRSPNLFSADGAASTVPAKKSKLTPMTSLQSRGHLQIEHFFGKTNR